MKTVLLFIAFIVIGSSNVFAQCSDPGPCSAWSTPPVTMSFVLPSFPLCPIICSVQTRVCNGVLQIRITDPHYPIPTSPTDPCKPLADWLQDPLSMTDRHNYMWQVGYESIANQLFDDAYNALPLGSKYLLECPNGTKLFNFLVEKCGKNCIYNDNTNHVSYVVRKPCNGGQCCKTTYTICRNTVTNTNDVIKTTETSGTPTECWDSIEYPCDPTYTIPGVFVVGSAPSTISVSFITNCSTFCD